MKRPKSPVLIKWSYLGFSSTTKTSKPILMFIRFNQSSFMFLKIKIMTNSSQRRILIFIIIPIDNLLLYSPTCSIALIVNLYFLHDAKFKWYFFFKISALLQLNYHKEAKPELQTLELDTLNLELKTLELGILSIRVYKFQQWIFRLSDRD